MPSTSEICSTVKMLRNIIDAATTPRVAAKKTPNKQHDSSYRAEAPNRSDRVM